MYGICEIAAPSNCDAARVTVTVLPLYVIDAVNDNGGVTFPGRTVVANVLANDTLGGTPATTARVTPSTVSSTAAGVTLDAATGSVVVALGTTAGTQTLTYRICEIVHPENCDDADVTVTVKLFVIDAVNDSGVVPKAGGTAVANVVANDKSAGGSPRCQGEPVETVVHTCRDLAQPRHWRGDGRQGHDRRRAHAHLPHLRDRDADELR